MLFSVTKPEQPRPRSGTMLVSAVVALGDIDAWTKDATGNKLAASVLRLVKAENSARSALITRGKIFRTLNFWAQYEPRRTLEILTEGDSCTLIELEATYLVAKSRMRL